MVDEPNEIARDRSLLAPQPRKLTSRLGWILAVVTILGHVVFMATFGALTLPTFIVPLLVVGFLSVPAILRRGGSLSLAVVLLLAFSLAAVLGLGAATGGLDSPFLLLLPALPITAVLLAGVHVARPTAVVTLAGLGLVGVLHGTGTLPAGEETWGFSLARAAAIAALCILVLILTGFYERQLDRLLWKLRAAATSDPLTGLANRGSLDDALAIEHHRLARYPDSCLSVILFDVDHLKEYNEANGHQAGDEVLKRIAEVALGRARRAPDVLGRYGGDEMLAVLPGTSGGDAAILADCIRRDIEGLAFAHSASPHGVVTVSVGVVTEPAANCGSIDSLLTDADQAVSKAKLNGRNCVVTGERAPEPTQ